MGGTAPGCKACGLSARLAPGELQRILSEYYRGELPPLAEGPERERRLALCGECPDLLYGNTCRHCGCLVEARAGIAGQGCPGPSPRW
jgi:hypothetical protein